MGLAIATTPILGQTDYILEQGICFIPPYGGDVYTHTQPGGANSIVIQSWTLPPVLKPGQQRKVTVKFKVFTNHSPVFYINYFGDWQPNVELAQSSLYGGIPSADEVFTDTFEFTAPSTPGWYRMRFMWRGNFSPTPSFYGGTSSGVPNAFSELVFHVGYPLGVKEESKGNVPQKFGMSQNRPNPSSGVTNIAYQIPKKSKVSLKVYDSSGCIVRTLIDSEQDAGHYTSTWYGKDNSIQSVPNGNYFYRLNCPGSKMWLQIDMPEPSLFP